MASYGYAPAAGAKGGSKPLPATIFPPKFLRYDQRELLALLNQLRDFAATHVYMILLCEADFATGDLVTSYARLISLTTWPTPERGRRKPALTMKQMRLVIERLIDMKLLWRNAAGNEAQGELRLRVYPRKEKLRPSPKKAG